MQIPRLSVPEIAPNDADLVGNMVNAVTASGCVLVSSQSEPGDLGDLLARLAPAFGRPVHQKLSAANGVHPIRYSPGHPEYANANCGDLALHTDASFEPNPPLIMLMACEQPSPDGGKSVFASGDALLNHLATVAPGCLRGLFRPDAFRIKRDAREATRAVFSKVDGRVRMAFRYAEDLKMTIHPDAAEGFRLIRDWIADPASSQTIGLERGDVLVFDNSRVLHGRTAFPKDAGRALYGLWCDGDDAHPDLAFGIPDVACADITAA